MFSEIAPKRTIVPNTNGVTLDVILGSAIIYGILATWPDSNNFGGTNVASFMFSGDNNSIFDLVIPSKGSSEFCGPFLSSTNFQVTSTDGITVVIFHSHIGV